MAGLQLSGLASGVDWQSIVDQLMKVERAPITRLQTEQDKNSDRSDALSTLNTKMTALKAAITGLTSSGMYSRRSATLSSSTSTWSAKASDYTAPGSYTYNVTQLATASTFKGAGDIGRAIASDGNLSGITIATLPTTATVTAGNFTVNGKTIAVATTDSFSDVLARIGTATGGDVTATYDSANDKVVLTAAAGKTIVLGAANDSSNFLSALRLSNTDNATSLASSSALGALSTSATLANARLNTTLSGLDADNAGSFTINGVAINYDADTDSLSTILNRINGSSAGVSATYDSTNDRINITNTVTGDSGFAFSDTQGNLLSALGVTSGSTTMTRGKNALFSINGGGTLTSASNTLSPETSGIQGLTVTATSEGSQTITVASDTTAARSAIDSFISKFNDVQDYIEQQSKITTSNGKVTTSTLSNNREVQEWGRKLRQLAFQAFDGDIKRMTDLGIDFTAGTNKLTVKNSTTLDSALASKSSAVEAFFTTSSTGFARRFDSFMNSTLGDGVSTGTLQSQISSLSTANKSIDTQIADIERRLVQQRSILENSFIQMEQASQKSQNIIAQLTKSFS